jgi:hypothetical protein
MDAATALALMNLFGLEESTIISTDSCKNLSVSPVADTSQSREGQGAWAFTSVLPFVRLARMSSVWILQRSRTRKIGASDTT